jgi:hypothetical protein
MAIDWPALVDGGIPFVGGLYATAVGLRPAPAAAPSRWAARLRPHLRWMGPLLVLFGLFNGWQDHLRAAHPSAQDVARAIAAQAGLPKKVDAITTAEDVTGAGNVITYHFTVAGTLRDDDAQAKAEVMIHRQLVSSVCNSSARQLLNEGYIVEGRYRIGDRELLATVYPQSC